MTEETPEQRDALDVATADMNAALDALDPPDAPDYSRIRPEDIHAAAATLNAGAEELRKVGWALLAEADERATYHGKMYRVTALSSTACAVATALWVTVSQTTTAWWAFVAALAISVVIAFGGSWWAVRATRRAYRERVARIEAITGRPETEGPR